MPVRPQPVWAGRAVTAHAEKTLCAAITCECLFITAAPSIGDLAQLSG